MKKLFLLFAAGACAFNASAQAVNGGSLLNKHKEAAQEYNLIAPANVPASSANKTTAAPTRWYAPWDVYNLLNGGDLANNQALIPIWFSPTILQRFSTGLDTINYLSVAQVIDPRSSDNFFNDDAVFSGEMKVESFNSYTVDSISVRAAYIENPNRSAAIVDTLILGVSSSTHGYYYFDKNSTSTDNSWVAFYTGADTLRAFAPLDVDSLQRAVVGSPASTPPGNEKIWKVLLTSADRTPPDAQGNVTLTDFAFVVPGGGLNVPAGQRINVSVTFKSGDTWVSGVDTFNHFHNFRPVTSFISQSSRMTYYGISGTGGDLGDRNGSALMFSTDTAFYAPSIAIEGWNTADFRYEYHQIGAHVVCNDCFNVSAGNIANKQIKEAGAYPNPASTVVNVPFTLTTAADVHVTLTNTVGQVVASQTISNTANGKASFNTAALSNGVYIYTVEANGERMTGRVSVAH